MKVRIYDLVDRAVEEGVAMGFTRSFKHLDVDQAILDMIEPILKEHMHREVMNSLAEVIDFNEEFNG